MLLAVRQFLSHRRVTIAPALALSIIELFASPVVADPWGTNTSDTGAHPDSNPHTYCFENQHVWDSYVQDMENNALDGPTNANVQDQTWTGGCDFDSFTETDVYWRGRDLPGTTRGETFCENFDTHCDQFYVSIDYNYIVQNSYPATENVKKTICHELGHTVGLTHGSTYGGCMVSGAVSADLQWRRYSEHHKGHINAWFN